MISIGLDVGRESDPAALAVLHTTRTRADSHRPQWTALSVGNIELGTSYQRLAGLVAGVGRDFVGAGYPVVATVDATGIGAAVVELARDADPELHIVALTIGAGRSLTHAGPDAYTVGKHRLTEVLQVALQQDGLSVADCDGARELRDQIGRFVAVPTATGYQRHEAAAGGHDDLVLAVELALWTGDTMFDQQAGVAP